MLPRAEVIAIGIRNCKKSDTVCKGRSQVCGFALGYLKSKKVFYIDLVCTNSKQGKPLLDAMEEYAAAKKVDIVGLRTANDALIPYYAKRGYRRVTDACSEISGSLRQRRAVERQMREHIDKYATSLPNARLHITDGMNVASSIADAWKLAEKGGAKPKNGLVTDGRRIVETPVHAWSIAQPQQKVHVPKTRRTPKVAEVDISIPPPGWDFLPQGWSISRGVITDDKRVANTVADAWLLEGRSPKKIGLPAKWRFEGGHHGRWMSKCMKTV